MSAHLVEARQVAEHLSGAGAIAALDLAGKTGMRIEVIYMGLVALYDMGLATFDRGPCGRHLWRLLPK